jgi:hypothetical protein
MRSPLILFLLIILFGAWFVILREESAKDSSGESSLPDFFPSWMRKNRGFKMFIMQILPTILLLFICPYVVHLLVQIASSTATVASSHFSRLGIEKLIEARGEAAAVTVSDTLLYNLLSSMRESLRVSAGVMEARPNSAL